MRLTVLGGQGFIGRHVVADARRRGVEVTVLPRDTRPVPGADLGHVIYAIGLTADFRTRPFDTVEAHVGLLADWLQQGKVQSFLYLSSTRVYGGLDGLVCEDTPLSLTPSIDGLYDLSKLTGEALCLADPRPTLRVARLSNIYGPGMSEATFLGAVLRDLRLCGRVTICEDPASAKDYLHIDDAARLLVDIALTGRERTYNVASGIRTTHAEIAEVLCALPGYQIDFLPQAPRRIFPHIDTRRIAAEFPFAPTAFPDALRALSLRVAARSPDEDDHAAIHS